MQSFLTWPPEPKYLQVYQRFQAPESERGYGCDLVVFNKPVKETLHRLG